MIWRLGCGGRWMRLTRLSLGEADGSNLAVDAPPSVAASDQADMSKRELYRGR